MDKYSIYTHSFGNTSTMEELFTVGLTALLSGGPGAVMILLVAIIGWLLLDRKSLKDENIRKDAKFDKILDDYYRGNITITEALNSLKIVLAEIKGKL